MMAETERQEQPQLTKADLKREFGLTDTHIVLLGEPDGGPGAVPLYSRTQVDRWVAENQTLLMETAAKRQALEARRAREREDAEVRRDEARRTVAAAVVNWKREDVASPEELVEKVRASLSQNFAQFSGEANERAIFAHILDRLTNYTAIARTLARQGAGFELSAAVKIYIACQIIREYGLNLDPLDCAFSGGVVAMLPPDYRSEDPETVASRVIGLQT